MPSKQKSDRRLILITGLSGSGKSTAAKALEDIGYFCVDNMPLELLRIFLEDPFSVAGNRSRIAVVTDVRAPGFAERIVTILDDSTRTYRFDLLFLEAAEDSLVRRFSETRRTHPIATGDRPVIDGIRRERSLLADLRATADLIVDTSDWSVHDVRNEIQREFGEQEPGRSMVVSLVSFGFKHGIPAGSDLLIDVRFLPNPYFIPGLREKSGQDSDVREFLEGFDDYHELVDKLLELYLFLLPRYRSENRSYVSLAIGCTGGRHRSVSVAERMARLLSEEEWQLRLVHRDLGR